MEKDLGITNAKELKTEEQVRKFLEPRGYRPMKVTAPGGGAYYNWGKGSKIYSRKRALQIEVNKNQKLKAAVEAAKKDNKS